MRNNRLKMKYKGKHKSNRVNKSHDASKKKSKKQKGESMEIFDLNDDCLIEIFLYLNIDEMVCVAEASERFAESARAAFACKYAKDPVAVTNFDGMKTAQSLSSTKLLRHFGGLIKKLRVKYHSDFHRFDSELENAICKYGENMNEIELVNCDSLAFMQIQKQPFSSIEKVLFTRCALGRFVFEFNQWFPNARSLDFVNSKMFHSNDAKCIEQHFSKLEHLGIVNPREGDDRLKYRDVSRSQLESHINRHIFTNTNLMAAIDWNPQLKSLKLRHNNDNGRSNQSQYRFGIKITGHVLTQVNTKLPLLESLDLTITQMGLLPNFNRSQLYFKNLKRLSIHFCSSFLLQYLPIKTSQLDELILSGEELDDECSLFILRQKQCRKLTLSGEWDDDECFNDAMKAIKGLTTLEHIELPYNGLTNNNKQFAIISLLNECKSLKHLAVGYFKYMKLIYNVDEESDIDSDDEYGSNTYQRNLMKLSDTIKRLPGKIITFSSYLLPFGLLSTDHVLFSALFLGWLASYENEIFDEGLESDDDTSDDDMGFVNYFEGEINESVFIERFRSAFELLLLGSNWKTRYTNLDGRYWAKYDKQT